MEIDKKARLIEGPVGKTLLKLTIPMLIAHLGMMVFNLVDTFFVAQIGTKELAAMSFTFPVVLVLGGLVIGISVGASAAISRALGEGNYQKVQRLTTDSLTLSLLVVVGFVIVGLYTVNNIFRLLGATPAILPLIRQYMLIWFPGTIFFVIPMVGNSAIRATGDTKTASAVMLTGIVINIILDPLLIFGIGPFPRLELAGAAIATVIARAMVFFLTLWILFSRKKMATFVLPKIKTVLNSWKRILYIALPTAGTNIVIPLSVGIITRLIANYGAEAVAAYGVASRMEMFVLRVLGALGMVLGPFIGQNWGAERYDRVNLGVKYSKRFAMGWGAAIFILLVVAGNPIASLFSDHQKVISIITTYFWIVPIGYGFQGMLRLCAGALNMLNKPMHAALLIITQAFVLYIPLAYAGSSLFGLNGIFCAAALSFISAGIAAHLLLKRYLVKTNTI